MHGRNAAQLTSMIMFWAELTICQHECHWTAQHEEFTDVKLKLVDTVASVGTAADSWFPAVGSGRQRIRMTRLHQGPAAVTTMRHCRAIWRPTENIVGQHRTNAVSDYTHLHTTTYYWAEYSLTSVIYFHVQRLKTAILAFCIVHRDRKKNGPPKHVKITLWIENVNHYFSSYHEKPSIFNVCVKFHDN